MIKRQGWRNVKGLADESCVNGATVISIDESILPSGNSDTVFVEGNRNIESEINSGLDMAICPQCNSRRSCSLIN